jgi:iron complex outermembrane receptor protein
MWTPTIKGFWTPENIAAVKSEGVESRISFSYRFSARTQLSLNAIFAYTSSLNNDAGSENFGKQLPYIPLISNSAGAHLSVGPWEADLKWRYYSERYTSYSGTHFGSSVVPAYSVGDLSVGREIEKNKVHFKVRFEVNNLLNASYQSILSRPMPPRNYALSVECRWRQKQ